MSQCSDYEGKEILLILLSMIVYNVIIYSIIIYGCFSYKREKCCYSKNKNILKYVCILNIKYF